MRWYICSFSSFLTKANVCTSHRYCLKPFKWSLAKASKGGCIKGAKGTSFVSTIVQYKCKFVASFRCSWLRVGFTLKLISKGPNLYLKVAIDIYVQVTSVCKKCNFLSCWFASNRALVCTFLRGLLFVGFDKQILQYQGHHCYIKIRSVILQLSIALMFCWWACNWWSRRKGHLSIQAMHRE